MDSILKLLGFVRCYSDPCVYHRTDTRGRVFITLYVDDILTLSNNNELLLEFESDLAKHVQKLTLKGDAQGYIGLEFKRDRLRKTITITQSQYLKDLMHSEGLDNVTPKPTPASTTVDLNRVETGTCDPMRTLVGKIRYVVDHTHPEALFIASQLSSACAAPGDKHWDAANHLLRYFKGALHEGLTLGGPEEINPEIYVDASYIEDGAALSQLGYCMRLNKVSGMILSKSIRDKAVSLSASEAELRALKEATQEVMWLRYFMWEINFVLSRAIPIFEDNQAVINLVETLKICSRTRHLNTIKMFIMQQMSKQRIKVNKISGENNIADILTKNMDKTRFEILKGLLLGNNLASNY
jgi:Reverse transcriptase (RNA-dependent DNA polymerase)